MQNSNWKTIGTNIKVLRERYGFSQIEVANFLGLKDHATISYYENGERAVPLEQLKKIADLFAVSLESLFSEERNTNLANAIFAFRKDDLKENDFSTLANFHRIVKNYIKLVNLEKKHAEKS